MTANYYNGITGNIIVYSIKTNKNEVLVKKRLAYTNSLCYNEQAVYENETYLFNIER